jgi:hypothetical protein
MSWRCASIERFSFGVSSEETIDTTLSMPPGASAFESALWDILFEAISSILGF